MEQIQNTKILEKNIIKMAHEIRNLERRVIVSTISCYAAITVIVVSLASPVSDGVVIGFVWALIAFIHRYTIADDLKRTENEHLQLQIERINQSPQ